MRLKSLIVSDIRFQFRYGFYWVYILFTLVYVAVLHLLPAAWRTDAALLMIFTDPAAMGLFFMGSIVLFEKNERVLDSIAVSPVSPIEYVLSKLVSASSPRWPPSSSAPPPGRWPLPCGLCSRSSCARACSRRCR